MTKARENTIFSFNHPYPGGFLYTKTYMRSECVRRDIFTTKVWLGPLHKHIALLPNLDVPNLRVIILNSQLNKTILAFRGKQPPVISVEGPMDIWYKYIHPEGTELKKAHHLLLYDLDSYTTLT